MRSLLRGQQKGPLPVGWGGERQRVLKSVSWKNSQLLSTWPYTIVRKRREGRVDGRMDGWSEGAGGGGDEGGGGVGGQRLKLHHKSHPERKHEVVPPPFSIHLSPLSPPVARPSPLSSPLFLCTESAPWMDQVYFILLLHVLQTPNSPNFYSTPPLFIYLSSLSLPRVYQPVARL